MALNPLSGAGAPGISGPGATPKVGSGQESFGKVMKAQTSPRPAQAHGETAPVPVQNAQATQAKAVSQAAPGRVKAEAVSQAKAAGGVEGAKAATAAKVLDQVTAAQKRMDHVLKLAESGKAFSPAELLTLQAHVYRASQELDLAGKVVEKATGGVKQVLQTQV